MRLSFLQDINYLHTSRLDKSQKLTCNFTESALFSSLQQVKVAYCYIIKYELGWRNMILKGPIAILFPSFHVCQLSFQSRPNMLNRDFPGGSVVKKLPARAGDTSSIPGLVTALGEGNGNPLQYSCLGYPMDREAWWATVHGVAKESDVTQQLNNNTMLNYLYVGKTTSQFSEN